LIETYTRIADSFGRGDIWFLLNKKTEFDDGVVAIGPPYETLIDNFVNHELIKNKDIDQQTKTFQS
jgi:hypothetical protein